MLRHACKHQVPAYFLMATQNGDMDHTEPLRGPEGLDMEMIGGGALFKFWSLFRWPFKLVCPDMTSLGKMSPSKLF